MAPAVRPPRPAATENDQHQDEGDVDVGDLAPDADQDAGHEQRPQPSEGDAQQGAGRAVELHISGSTTGHPGQTGLCGIFTWPSAIFTESLRTPVKDSLRTGPYLLKEGKALARERAGDDIRAMTDVIFVALIGRVLRLGGRAGEAVRAHRRRGRRGAGSRPPRRPGRAHGRDGGGGMTSYDNVVGAHPRRPGHRVPRLRPRAPGEALMTAAAWLQLVLPDRPAGDLDAAARPLHGQGVRRGQGAGRPGLRPGRAGDLPGWRRRPRAGAALDRLRPLAARLQPGLGAGPLRAAPAPGPPAAQPRQHGGGAAGAVVQHRGQLPHQHQLAELLGRVDDVAPHPDGGPGVPQLRVGRRAARRSPSP